MMNLNRLWIATYLASLLSGCVGESTDYIVFKEVKNLQISCNVIDQLPQKLKSAQVPADTYLVQINMHIPQNHHVSQCAPYVAVENWPSYIAESANGWSYWVPVSKSTGQVIFAGDCRWDYGGGSVHMYDNLHVLTVRQVENQAPVCQLKGIKTNWVGG